ncbi:type VI secretion system baseplate subunit TssE [Chitinimonas arctica]|uniref:Type VI secretion system baseplate subunit TssE n=1 Tax=Chitinimonas arctica TaxID=2594795 RepID=A0A516SBB9_9NEIS|nr:type VI secretion system baseplate subunit TssE [Chitinimonas arctica]QDQ25439.1 type VI secretion system baseplate subunit TssE [Chitinimonas arctica]
MAELSSKDRLQPSLLDRLTDLEPEQRHESRESRVLSMRQLRQSVRRDLTHLLNTTHLQSRLDLSDFAPVRQSVLNFGMPELAGKTASGMKSARLAEAIAEAIRVFEPRIMPDSLKVSAINMGDANNCVSYLIEGDLWAQPYPERLYFKTDLDLEVGQVRLHEHTP